MNNSVTTVKKKNKKLSKGVRISKQVVATLTAALIMCVLGTTTAFAAGGQINTTDFIDTAGTVLKSVICGVGVWGVVNLLEGYGNDNPGAKSQGMKQLMAGVGLILLGLILTPVLISMMKSAL